MLQIQGGKIPYAAGKAAVRSGGLDLRDALSGSVIPGLPFIRKPQDPFAFQLPQKVLSLAGFMPAIGALTVQQFAHRTKKNL